MTDQLIEQIQAYSARLDAQSQDLPVVDHGRGTRSRGRVAMSAASVVLIVGIVAALWVTTSGDDDSTVDPATVTTEPDSNEVDEELQAAIDEALANAEPRQRPHQTPIGEPWTGSVSTSDGPQELTVARTVGDRLAGDGFCVDSCYGAGFSQDLDEPRPMSVTGPGSLEPDEPARAVFWVPHDADELTIRWDDGTTTTAETVQPFGAGTVRITVVAVPDGVETGMFTTGGDEHPLDVVMPTGP